MRWASPLATAVVVVVVAVSTFGFLATRHSNDQQGRALLQNDIQQAAALAFSIRVEVRLPDDGGEAGGDGAAP